VVTSPIVIFEGENKGKTDSQVQVFVKISGSRVGEATVTATVAFDEELRGDLDIKVIGNGFKEAETAGEVEIPENA
jgi:hypothetical protein